ncbi:SOS response-associated peptidase family protein [Alteromonas gilva]|uniref:Abasic site processing protein n=1 Tax=Alteromonas gilva TaxID=2987522 RepID=A0ABT5L1X4_9ALTE|nr:SOS response-associated peptidase family protein [Alteromonas gilva]MDC8831025.1 SOS response-associated peptidase family protein [Alteromonas gilva]
MTDNPALRDLCEQLEIDFWPHEGMRFSRFIRATERLTIVFEQNNQRIARNALWWLLLEPDHSELSARFRPSKYTSFNTRYDKLNVPRSAGYHAYRQQRCVIPAAGFGETQKTGGQMHYHDLIADLSEPLAMGGLYREWHGHDRHGNVFTETSCSVVTLPPHPKLTAIHQKSTPLMLSVNDGSLGRWLDSGTTEPAQLDDLLVPKIRHSFTVYPINKPSLYQTISEPYNIAPDV